MTENDGFYTWIVPDTVSTQCWVRLSEAEDGLPLDMSDSFFSIIEAESEAEAGSETTRGIKRRSVKKSSLQQPGQGGWN
jgi:hypothetical protein